MNKLSKYIINNNEVIIKKPIISLFTLEDLNKLPNDRSKYLKLYKNFLKLRNIVDTNYNNQILYQTILKRNFRHHDFSYKRKLLLNDSRDLTSNEIFERLLNTLVFVFNSTVRISDEPTKPILFYEDIQSQERIEKSIISTILAMDAQKPNFVKYDFKYNWLIEFNKNLDSLPDSPTYKQYKSLFKDDLHLFIGFKQYETNLMRLNESLKLCL